MARNTMAKALIRQMAQDAKERLINNGYGSRQENLALKRRINKNNNLRLYETSKKPEITIKIINDYDNSKFKQKVYELLDSNIDSTNPLSQLIDKTEFESLSENEKERYMLNISEQYTNIRSQYYNTYC